MKKILGISAFYHDSAAALTIGGELIAAAQEERFSRKKHDDSFPSNSIRYVLSEAGIGISEIDIIAFYDKPYIKFERLLETYHAFAPSGLRSFLSSMPVWIKDKLFMKKRIWEDLEKINGSKFRKKPILLFPEHHLSHAASAFFPSPFEQAAILTIDGVGEWATTTICYGHGNSIKKLRELAFPHSIGLLYSAFTAYCGFKVNSGEYKLMGLAPYGHQSGTKKSEYREKILNNIVDLKPDGSILLNMDYFDYATGMKMFKSDQWENLFDLPPRTAESDLTQDYMDMALAIQEITEEIVLKLAETAKEITGSHNLVMAGGVALNCVANGKLLRSALFDQLWIQPAAGDAGGAVGAALASYYIWNKADRNRNNEISGEQKERKDHISVDSRERIEKPAWLDAMKGAYLGPEFSCRDTAVLKYRYNAVSELYNNFDELCHDVADYIADNQIVGWFQGRMEWGPRALGNRSILADPRSPETQKRLNLRIKYRESFRPFAPSVLAEDADSYFDMDSPSPYMLMVASVKEAHRKMEPDGYADLPMYERLYHTRSSLPAITHVDYSARIQSVHRETNLKYWKLINAFKKITGVGLVVNTSFNVRGEPIVCTPEDAYRCFMRTEMDILVIDRLVFKKSFQPEFKDNELWQERFELD